MIGHDEFILIFGLGEIKTLNSIKFHNDIQLF